MGWVHAGFEKGGIFRQTALVLIRTWMQWLPSALLLVSIGSAIGCSDDRRPPKSDLSQNDLKPEPRPIPDGGLLDCFHPGCACEQAGTTRECGTVKEQVAGYLWCSLGVQVCEDGVWSKCQSERIVLSKQMLNLSLQGLGESRSCAAENPCSPGCNLFEDDATGIPLVPEDGLIDDDGLSLAESSDLPGGACTGIEVTPGVTTLEVTSLAPLSPNTATFTARVLPEGCAGAERPVAWSVDRPDVATISTDGEVTLLVPVAGPIEVSALAGRLSGVASLDVAIALEDTSRAPAHAASNFGDDGEAPDTYLTWLYPYAGTVFPPNVNPPLVQWNSVVAAEASWNGGCGLRADGRVRCWGTNVYGDIADRPGPYVQLAGRYTHFCALTPAGSADCWGDNSYNQARNHAGPYVQVVVGAQHSCGLRPDGAAECWGRNQYGQISPPSARFSKLAAGAYTSCGIQENADVVCWGNDSGGQGGVTAGPFIEVTVGTDHVCAIRADQTLHCWGSGANGQTEAPAGSYVSLDAGTYHTCALGNDGHAACWGLNNYGQSTTAVGPFVRVSAAREHSCAVSVAGAVECFGNPDANRTVGLDGGSVRVGVRYPVTGNARFEWSSVVAESRLDYADAPLNEVAIGTAPRLPIPNAVWSALAASAGGAEFALTIQRHTGDRLLDVVERVVRFSESPLNGKIVYQSYGSRSVLNTTGTYESEDERWGAAVFAYDTNTKTSSVLAGFTSDDAATGVGAGCRGCHSVGADNHVLVSGFDNQSDAVVRALDAPALAEQAIDGFPREYGGALWSAVHPTLPLAFSSRGPTPCAVRVGEVSGSCAASDFASAAGDLQGTVHVLQSAPGGLLGSAWFDSDGDGVYDSSSPNLLLDLDADPGQIVEAEFPEGLRAAMPVFSPEGDRVAFVHYGGDVEDGVGTLHSGDGRSLGMMDFDSIATQPYNFQRITSEPAAPCDARFGGTQGCADLWPSFLPAGAGVVFQRQVFGNGELPNTTHSDFGGTRSGCELRDQSSCNDGAKGELWWVALDSDGQPTGRYRLTRASGVVNSDHLVTKGAFTTPGVSHSNEVEPLLNYQPSVAPRAYGTHNWVAFTSRRAYGNVATQNPWWSDPRVHPIGHRVTTKKLWVSALDAEAAADDPSAPAFYLDGQELRGANGRPVWVNDACVEPSDERNESNECESDADCCGAPDMARCEVSLPLASPAVRHCVAVDSESCLDADSTRLCQVDEECCGVEDGQRCMSGRCGMPPPLVRYEQATFVRDYRADCPNGALPQWKFLEWQARFPEGTSIKFDAATAQSKVELDDVEMVHQATATAPDANSWTTWGSEDEDSIDAKLTAEGYPSREWLRVWITLIPDESRLFTPVLETWRLVYDCADGL